MDDKQILSGGNMSHVYKSGDTVIRKRQEGTPTIHRFLNHLEARGFEAAPRVIALRDDVEVLSYMEGEVIHAYPGTRTLTQRKAIVVSVATLMRKFHDASQDFPVRPTDVYFLSYEGHLDKEVICHNDIAPYNVTFNGTDVQGFFDFDTICPGPRIWDVAYAVYRFASLGNEYPEHYNNQEHQNRIYLTKLFCDAYGCESVGIINIICDRLQSLIILMDREIEKGNQAFIKMKNDGHQDFYKHEILFLQMTYKNDFI